MKGKQLSNNSSSNSLIPTKATASLRDGNLEFIFTSKLESETEDTYNLPN